MGALPLLAAVLAALAVAVLLRPVDDDRLARAVPRPGRGREGPGVRRGRDGPAGPGAGRAGAAAGGSSRASGPTAACLLAAVATALVVGGPAGLLLAAGVALAGPRLLGRLEPRAAREEREQLVRDLPLVLDLLASCLAGGATLPEAARAVSGAVGGPAGRRLAAVEAALAVGAPPAQAWAALAGPPGEEPRGGAALPGADGGDGGDGGREADALAPAARALSRAAEGGAPVAAAVSRLAAEARADARSRGEQAARRVGVLAVAPLGLCFLPAFVLLGVVPVVVGLVGPLLAAF